MLSCFTVLVESSKILDAGISSIQMPLQSQCGMIVDMHWSRDEANTYKQHEPREARGRCGGSRHMYLRR